MTQQAENGYPRGKYERDAEALAWARAKTQSAIDKARDFERQCKERGDTDRARDWARVAWFIDHQLVGSGEGCVVTAFDARWPQFADAVYPISQENR